MKQKLQQSLYPNGKTRNKLLHQCVQGMWSRVKALPEFDSLLGQKVFLRMESKKVCNLHNIPTIKDGEIQNQDLCLMFKD